MKTNDAIKLESGNVDKRIKSAEEVFQQIGYGKSQIQILIVVSLILITSLNENIGISFILPAAQCDLNLTTRDKGLLSGMVSLGIMISSYFWGFYADTQGRRHVILLALSASTCCTIISVFLNSFVLFALCKFTTGIFVSGFAASVYAFVGEFNTDKNRGTIISLLSMGVGFAAIIQPLLAWWILSYEWSFEIYSGYFFRPWRLLMLVYISPGIIGFLWLLKLPESPKYFLSQNEKEKALDVMRWMYRVNKGDQTQLDVDELESERAEISIKNQKGLKPIWNSLVNQTLPLFKPPHVHHFFTCAFLHFGTFAIAGGLSLFLPDVLNKLAKAREGDSEDLKICDVLQRPKFVTTANLTDNSIAMTCDDSVNTSVFIDSALIGVAQLIGFLLISMTIKCLGRRKLFIFTLLAATFSGLFIPMTSSRHLILILYCLFILFPGVNVSTINSAACDLFPTHLRAMAVCVTMLFGRLGSVSSSNFIGYMIESNCELTFYIYTGLIFACFLISFVIPDSNNNKK